jgi:hypothetical protein
VTENVFVLVECGVRFYQDLLDLETIDMFQFGSRPVYARLRSPKARVIPPDVTDQPASQTHFSAAYAVIP